MRALIRFPIKRLSNNILNKSLPLATFCTRRFTVYYSSHDEWISVAGKEGTIGITDYAQDLLQEIIYVDLPKVGENFKAEEAFGDIESTKSSSALYMPVTGTITEVNSALGDGTDRDLLSIINGSAEADGWLVKVLIEDESDLKLLKSKKEYDDSH